MALIILRAIYLYTFKIAIPQSYTSNKNCAAKASGRGAVYKPAAAMWHHLIYIFVQRGTDNLQDSGTKSRRRPHLLLQCQVS